MRMFYLFLIQEKMGGRKIVSGFGERAIAYEINNLADEDARMSAIRTRARIKT